MADYLNIAGRVRTTASDGVAMEAQELKDLNQNKSQQEINADVQTALGDRYTKEETYSKEQLDDLITTPDVNYVSVVATNATTAVTDILPATGEANTIYRVGNWDGTQYDPTMYALFAWNGSAYVCLAVRSFVGEVYDVSVNHPDGQGNPTPYADLTAALGTNGANIPADIRRGGMSIKFIQGTAQSSDNKYVQYRLMNDSWSSTESDWQGMNTNITPENHNLVESENIFDSQMFANSLAGLLSNGFYPLIDYSLRYTNNVYVGIRYTPEYGDCCFVAVANNSTKITVSGKTPFSYSYFSAIDINVDKWMTRNWNGNIPSGAKLCVINFRKEDNVETPGFDTLVVTQDNNVVFDNKLQLSLDTINNEALERETSINTEVIEELSRPLVLSDVTRVTGWIGTNQVYNQGNHITLDVTNITKIKITATQEKKCVYLLLTEKYNKDGEGWTFADYPSFLCNGETSRREIAAGQTQIISISSDCKYILIGISSNDIDIDNYIPSEVIIGEGEGRVIQELEEIQEELNRNVDNELSIDASELTQLPGWIGIGGWKSYNNNGTHVTIDITGYSNVKLTANSDRDTFFFFAKDDFVEPIGNTSYMTYLCEGETGRRSVTKGETSIFNIPSDCKYICIGCISSATYDYSPVSTILALAKGLKQRTTELENEVTKIGDDIKNINTRITRKIKILSIGNSFSQDSFSYVPMLLESIVPDIDITLGILYKGSCSLQMHWENRESSNYYTFGIYKTSIGSWSIENSKGLDYGLEYTDWDIITLQQNSANSDNYSTYQPYLNNLIGYIAGKCSNYKLGWLLTHSWADGYSSYNSGSAHGGDSNGMSALIKAAAKKVMDETTVDILFPYGSAIQNARQNTVLNALGNGGQMCGGNEAIGANANKVHLNEGMPCQVAAYTNVLVILDVISAYKGINGNDIRVDASFVTTYNIPGPHGTAEGSTDANCIIGQRAASLAVRFPWVLQSSDVMNDD